MNKETLLEEIRKQAATGHVNLSEIEQAYDQGKGLAPQAQQSSEQTLRTLKGEAVLSKRATLTDVLFYIGGAVVFLGLVILTAIHWQDFNSGTKVIVTLGAALAAFIMAVIFDTSETIKPLSAAFHLIAALLLPVGLFVTIITLDYQPSIGWTTLVFALLSVLYIVSIFLWKRTLLALFSLIFSTLFYVSLVSYILSKLPTIWNHSSEYTFLALGLSYILLARFFSSQGFLSQSNEQGEAWHSSVLALWKPLSGVMYAFGSIFVLTSTLILGGYKPDQNLFWEIIYPLLTLAAVYVSVIWKSRSLLVFGAIFLMVYIIKITSEYFAHSFGWPISLIIIGLLFIVVAYILVRINKKYME